MHSFHLQPCTRPIRDPADALSRGFVVPFPLFRCWQWDALRSGLFGRADTMVLATACAKTMQSSQRPMQLADTRDDTFMFLSTEHSRKGCQIAQNSRVSLFFDWLAMGRYVAVEGKAKIVRDQQLIGSLFNRTFTPEMCRYFYAIDSSQSLAIDDVFKQRFQDEMDALNRDCGVNAQLPLPPPPSMVLFRVKPVSFEFQENSQEIGNVRLRFSRTSDTASVDNKFTFCGCPGWSVEQIAQ